MGNSYLLGPVSWTYLFLVPSIPQYHRTITTTRGKGIGYSGMKSNTIDGIDRITDPMTFKGILFPWLSQFFEVFDTDPTFDTAQCQTSIGKDSDTSSLKFEGRFPIHHNLWLGIIGTINDDNATSGSCHQNPLMGTVHIHSKGLAG